MIVFVKMITFFSFALHKAMRALCARGVPAHLCCAKLVWARRNPYPVLRTGSEFNELAPHVAVGACRVTLRVPPRYARNGCRIVSAQ